jgi:predicted TIM-barrel fold metal-dependent hydrolase
LGPTATQARREKEGGTAMRMIDTHLHTIDLTALPYPWLDDFAPLRKDFSAATYEAEARRCGVTDALHMEVDVRADAIEAETDYVAKLVARPDSLIRGAISACRPESGDFPAALERALASGIVHGFRRVLHTQPEDLSESALFRANINRLADTGTPFDICMTPAQLRKAIALVDACPRVTFVVDHCGIPGIKDGMTNSWRDDIAALAERPNVNLKISGIVAYASETWRLDDLRPYVEHCIARFGWDRVVWGSDWPVCTLNGSLSTWVAATHELIAGASLEEREKFLWRNANRVWRLQR